MNLNPHQLRRLDEIRRGYYPSMKVCRKTNLRLVELGLVEVIGDKVTDAAIVSLGTLRVIEEGVPRVHVEPHDVMHDLDAHILGALDRCPRGVFTSAIRKAIKVDCARTTLLRRLKRLEMEGKVERAPTSFTRKIIWRKTS